MIEPSDVEKAKEAVILSYERNRETNRRWLRADLDSYDQFSNRVTVLALEGSPAKGIIIINHGTNTIMAFDSWGKRLKLKQKQ